MIGISPLAREKLAAYLAEKKIEPQVRVKIDSGCGGGGLILALDKPDPGDISAEFGPLTLCMSRDLYEEVGGVRVDFHDLGYDSGFVVESERPTPGGGGCAGCADCG